MDEMKIDFEEIEKEIARREQLDEAGTMAASDDDFMGAIAALFKQNPAAFIEKHPNLANQLMLQQANREKAKPLDSWGMSDAELERCSNLQIFMMLCLQVPELKAQYDELLEKDRQRHKIL